MRAEDTICFAVSCFTFFDLVLNVECLMSLAMKL